MFDAPAVAETERYQAPQKLAEFEVRLYANGQLLVRSEDPKLWARVLVLLLEVEDPDTLRAIAT